MEPGDDIIGKFYTVLIFFYYNRYKDATRVQGSIIWT
jgi:hypothetical protein